MLIKQTFENTYSTKSVTGKKMGEARKSYRHQVDISTHAPVQWVVLHAEVVSGKVSGGVAQVVVLIPEHPLTARGGRDDLHLDWQFDCGGHLTTRH